MLRFIRQALGTALIASLVIGCGGSPPSGEVHKEIEQAVRTANTQMLDATPEAADVVNIQLAGWKENELMGAGGPVSCSSEWTAKLRFKEPIAYIVVVVDGTKIVKVIADKGEELEVKGTVGGIKHEGKWIVNASAKGDLMGPGAWKPLWDKAGGLTMGYQVISQGVVSGSGFRSRNFETLSKLQPCIVEGSPEEKKFAGEVQERQRKQMEIQKEQQRQRQETQAEQQRLAKEEQERVKAANTEKQRLAQEEQKRLQTEATEKQRFAQEEAKKKAADLQHARLIAVLTPLQSKTGAVIVAEAGAELGAVILDATIDDAKLTVKGNAVDLRQMPFRKFTYEGAVDARGSFSFNSSLGGEPVVYGASGNKLVSRAGFTLTALGDAERVKSDLLIQLGERLQAVPAAALKVETLDAAATKAREPQLKLSGLAGTVFYKGRVNAAFGPLFSGDLAAAKPYVWRNKEIVALRLNEAVKGSGLYIRGGSAVSSELIVTINGVHRVNIPTIPKLGGAVIELPGDLEILDIRLEAPGTVSSRTIGLMK